MLLTMARHVPSQVRHFSAHALTIADAGCLSHASAQQRQASAQASQEYCISSLPRSIMVAESVQNAWQSIVSSWTRAWIFRSPDPSLS
jgi:hypothetical protein